MASEQLEIAKRAFSEIGKRFPHLRTAVDEGVPVELSVTLPVQSGLKYNVNVNLQNRDELHFAVSHFWLEWFPCTEPARVEEFIAAVSGFLSGQFRIVEHYRGSKCIKAELQAPDGGGWKTIGTRVSFSIPVPWLKRHIVVLHNA